MTQVLSTFTSWVKDTARYYNTVYELSRLSDKELSEIGLTRSEIVLVASHSIVRDHTARYER
jgi:uncharacterized protein YjiS (DUF1127 family)